jgi:fumarate hydratase, class I
MATPEFTYQKQFPLGDDTTEYYLLSNEYVASDVFAGREIVKVTGDGLTLLSRRAMHDCSFMLRTSHLKQVAQILTDPEASENDRFVALTMLRNAEVAVHGELPFCQDTGTAVVMAKKGQQIWTGGGDEEAIARGIYQTYTEENLRYSQTIALDMYNEKNSGTNLPAQIDIYSTDGDQYNFLFIAKGGGSANKTSLFQETKTLLNPLKLESFLIDKLRSLGTAACPPYHVAFVIGGTSADACLKTVKLASAKYLDDLPV